MIEKFTKYFIEEWLILFILAGVIAWSMNDRALAGWFIIANLVGRWIEKK